MEENIRKQQTLTFLGMVLEPIARLMLRAGVTWKEFSELSKKKFVAVATDDFGIRGRPTNASRVAILTGLDRREVQKLRSMTDIEPETGYQSRASQVLSAWHHDPEFVDGDGAPKPLPIEGESSSFTDLMRRYAPALPVTAMVKQLKSVNAIEELPDASIRPLTRTFIPVGLPAERLRLWASVLSDVANTIEHNFTRTPDQPSKFERRALNLRIHRDALPEFRQMLETQGQAFLERIDDWLSAHASNDPEDDVLRLGAGIYHIEDRNSGHAKKTRAK